MKKIFLLPILMIFGSCFFSKKSDTDIEVDINQNDDTPYIRTFIFKIQKNEKDTLEIVTLEKVIQAKGYLKVSQGFHQSQEEEAYYFEFLDTENNVIEKAYAKNPLDKHFEVPDEDGHLEKINIKVKEDVVSVRINGLTPFSMIKVYKTSKGKKQLLTELPIQKRDATPLK